MTTWMNTFGYKMAWLAIKNTTPEEIIQKVSLPGTHIISWSEGMDKIYEDHGNPHAIFISPQIRQWSLVVGWFCFSFNSKDGKLETLKDRMAELSTIFEEVQAFATHRVSEYHHWILAKNGKIERRFAYSGERGEVLCNEGELTEGEKQLPWDRLKIVSLVLKPWFPNEEDVMNIAGKWSVNPQTIEDADINDKVCYLANIPLSRTKPSINA